MAARVERAEMLPPVVLPHPVLVVVAVVQTLEQPGRLAALALPAK